MTAPLLAFRAPPTLALPPGASPLLASILLAIELCQQPQQLADWWDWPAHRTARWHLSPEEAAIAAKALAARREALEPPTPKATPPSAHAPTARAVAPRGQRWLV